MLHAFTRQERRRTWSQGPTARTDAGLRMIARREGDAVFCRACDGDGVVMMTANRLTSEPFKSCTRCGGEGLEPRR